MKSTEPIIHVIDFEGSRKTGILEFGVATIENGSITRVCTSLCRGLAPPSQFETNVHHIHESHLINHSSFDTYWAYFNELRQIGHFAAHNASVENNLLKSYFPFPQQSSLVQSWGPWIDSLVLAKQHLPHFNEFSLGFLSQELNFSPQLKQLQSDFSIETRFHPHAALYDALCSALLLLHIAKERNLSLVHLLPAHYTEQQISLF